MVSVAALALLAVFRSSLEQALNFALVPLQVSPPEDPRAHLEQGLAFALVSLDFLALAVLVPLQVPPLEALLALMVQVLAFVWAF